MLQMSDNAAGGQMSDNAAGGQMSDNTADAQRLLISVVCSYETE